MRPEYQTTILNDQGLRGIVKVSDGTNFVTSGPHDNDDKNNPEQLIGAALATCLGATLEYIEKKEQLPAVSKVEVNVQQFLDKKGYKFYIDAKVSISGVDSNKAQEMLDEAETRCPVAKLLKNSDTVKIHL
ncbi:dihydroneopterin aldolase [Companilactobacillus sp. RD055328]|uniref:OsmC family protein n=1 Tax=Companilactobacillus sp. RD055328 TaxID=2916634 RepID=UPI001FC7FD62|nr:OsmC family protein [Companilactobacillus sp. RD055328]GKQ42367.1 dihydroneopterin aldolase [Companilactobacillus sp. RD055328]